MKNQDMKLTTTKQYQILTARWQAGLYCVLMLISLVWGCTVAPKKHAVKDLSQSFEADTIISAQTGKPISFEELIAELTESRVIYVGEKHTDQAHHDVQLKIIKEIFEKTSNLTVGMEMFDHSYQSVLDQWSNGELDEQTFLRKSHWYANWRFDFSLYRDILNFIQDHRIRLVALNIPNYIPPRIREGGIENLRAEEKKHLPQHIDTSYTAHREYLHKTFESHQDHFKGNVEFEDFYTAQCVWEDAMAEAVTQNLGADVMVVLAGNGHIQYKYGIPDRAFRRNQVDFRTVYLVGVGDKVNMDIADFIWVTE
jgi:uncharacterized iron-regulated protein